MTDNDYVTEVTYEINTHIYRLFSSRRLCYKNALKQALDDVKQNFNTVIDVLYKNNTNKLVVTYLHDAYNEQVEEAFFDILTDYYKNALTVAKIQQKKHLTT
jgi:hypothetical protein